MTTSVLHAIATGLPAITTDHGAFSEQVENGKNGFLVPEGDYKALAEKILDLMDHPEFWPSLGHAGRDLVKRRFNFPDLMEKQMDIYRDLVGGQKR